MELHLIRFTLPYLRGNIVYPYDIFASKRLYNIDFSPIPIFYVSNPNAKIFNLDLSPVEVCNWRELENVKLYEELFKICG